MKKLLQKINTKATRSILMGLVLALFMSAGASFVSAELLSPTVPFLGASSGLASRIGSLTVGSSSIASWMTDSRSTICTNAQTIGTETCLDVTGTGTFSNFISGQKVNVVETVTVTDLVTYNGSGGGSGFTGGIVPTFLIQNISATNDSMLVQSLGYYVLGVFNPRDYTTKRQVCADANGTLSITCSAGGKPK